MSDEQAVGGGGQTSKRLTTVEAYYYDFKSTGNESIDNILSAVAYAGQSYHSTGDWSDAPVQWIQDAADDAAKDAITLSALEAYVREETGCMGDDALADLLAHFKQAAGQEGSE